MEKQTLKQKLFEMQKLNLKFEKDSVNPYFKSKYLSLDSLWEKLLPELEERNLVISHRTENKEVVTTVEDLDSDEHIESRMPLPDNLDPQKIGSAVTYFKRYNLGQIFNIMTDDDDDGAKAKPTQAKPTQATPQEVDNSDLPF